MLQRKGRRHIAYRPLHHITTFQDEDLALAWNYGDAQHISVLVRACWARACGRSLFPIAGGKPHRRSDGRSLR